MLCARCGIEEGVKEFEDELLCSHCYNIRITAHRILKFTCGDKFSYSDRLAIERLIEKYKK